MTYWKNLAISKISKNDINIIKTKYEIMKLIVAANQEVMIAEHYR